MDATSTTPADPVIHLVIGPLSGVGVQPGGWIACDPFGVRPNPPLTQRTRDRQQATCPTCLSAVDPYPSLGDPHYEAEMNLRAMQDESWADAERNIRKFNVDASAAEVD